MPGAVMSGVKDSRIKPNPKTSEAIGTSPIVFRITIITKPIIIVIMSNFVQSFRLKT